MVLSLIEALSRRIAELERLDGVRQNQVAQMLVHQNHQWESSNQLLREQVEQRLVHLDGSIQSRIAEAVKGLERAPARGAEGTDEESSGDSDEGEMDRIEASLEAYSDKVLLVSSINIGNTHSLTSILRQSSGMDLRTTWGSQISRPSIYLRAGQTMVNHGQPIP
jgi:hypothetical protein